MKKVLFTLIASLTFALSASFTATASPLAYPVERIAGQDRIETAINISQKGWTTAGTVVICQYAAFPDSIASTPYAVSLNAPILLTQGNSLDPRVIEEIKRLQPSKVVLLGGTGILKPEIEEELKNLGLSLEVERIGGSNRYETSILLAQRVPSDTVILANGDDFPDALSAASYAGIKQYPIVLTSKKMPEAVVNYLNQVQPSQIIVIGGEGVVPTESLTAHNLNITTRLGGSNRYETNAAVVNYAKDSYTTDDIFLASGTNFPDAVAGTVLAAKYQAPLLLTEKDDIPSPVYTYLREHMKVEPPLAKTTNPTTSTPMASTKQGKITASGGLNLRESPSSSGTKLLTIPNGTVLTLLDEQNGWYKVTYQSKTGWINSEYITLVDSASASSTPATSEVPSNSISTPVSTGKGVITASSGLNLRATPSSTGEKIITIPKDTTVEILEVQSGWYKATYQSKTGWLAAEYVNLITPPVMKKGVIKPDNGLNLRATPSSSGEKLATVPAKTTIEILAEENGWYKTTYQNLTGWLSGEYVEIIQNTNNSAGNNGTGNNGTTNNPPQVTPPQDTSTGQSSPYVTPITIALSVNGTIRILGGTGVISSTAQAILEGQTLSKYKENQREFPSLPTTLEPEVPPTTEPENPQAPNTTYDPSTEVLVDPFLDLPANALAGKVIMLDPGHGGPDPGAGGPSKTYEKNNTLAIAQYLKAYLEQAGAVVLMTREDDRSPATSSKYTELEDLKARVAMANSCNAELFISIHNDSFTNPEASGTTVFYSTKNAKSNDSIHLATNIRSNLISIINTKDRGIKNASFYVLNNTQIPAVLIEVAFISNPYEEARLQNEVFRQNVAAGILKGIYYYYNTPIPLY